MAPWTSRARPARRSASGRRVPTGRTKAAAQSGAAPPEPVVPDSAGDAAGSEQLPGLAAGGVGALPGGGGPAADPLDMVAAVTAILHDEPQLTRDEVRQAAGVPADVAAKFWRCLGFAQVDSEESAFTPADAAALQAAYEPVVSGLLPEDAAMSLTRAVGRSMERMATWQLQVMEDVADEDISADRMVLMAQQLAERVEPVLVHVWRRHLVAHLSHHMACRQVVDGHNEVHYTVGFADLVEFTKTAKQMTERQLADLVQRFEATASDIVTSHDGRVVKTVGDEVLFVAHSEAEAAAMALDMSEEISPAHDLPPLRVGLAQGAVLERLGDVFGSTVNLASRLRGVAHPGSVLVDDRVARHINTLSGFAVRRLNRKHMRGIGWTHPWVLTRRMSRR